MNGQKYKKTNPSKKIAVMRGLYVIWPTHGAEQIYILFNSVFYGVFSYKGETYFAGLYDSRQQHT